MLRHNPQHEAELAALLERDRGTVDVSVLPGGTVQGHRLGQRADQVSVPVHGAIVEVHRDVLRPELPQADSGLDRHRLADRNFSTAVLELQFLNSDLFPMPLHLLFPLGKGLGRLISFVLHLLMQNGGGHVEPVHIVLEHPVGVEDRTEPAHRRLHHAYPFPGRTVTGTRIEGGNHLPFEEFVHGPALDLILVFRVLVFLSRADGPTGSRTVSLCPPSVQDTHVKGAVRNRLHPTRAAGLHRPPRRVQPDVRSLNHVPCYVDVVVLEEDHSVPERLFVDVLHDVLDDRLARHVLRVRLAGKDDLHGTFRIVQDPGEPFCVPEQEIASLVRRKPSGKADRQGLRVEHVLRTLDLRGQLSPSHELFLHPPAGKGDEPFPPPLVGPPQLGVRDQIHPFPDLLVVRVLDPPRAQISVVEVCYLLGDVGWDVYSVRDRNDRNIPLGERGPEALPHASRYFPVELAHPVAVVGETNGEHGHAEGFLVVFRIQPSQGQAFVEGQPEVFRVLPEVLAHQVGREVVVAGRYGRVGREDRVRLDHLLGRLEGEPTPFDQPSHSLQPGESGVPLVHVKNRGFQPESLEGVDPTHTEEDFLPEAHVLVAAVELRRDFTVLRSVLRQVRIEQEEPNATHLHPVDVHPDRAILYGEGKLDGISLGVHLLPDRHVLEVVHSIVFLLPSLFVQVLTEIALLVEQAHTDQGKVQVAR